MDHDITCRIHGMRWLGWIGLLIVFSTARAAFAASDAHACARIASPSDRLACFDAIYPASAAVSVPMPTSPGPASDIVTSVHAEEATRPDGETGARLYATTDEHGQPGLIIVTPASHLGSSPAYLVISCLSRISRLQLVLASPVAATQARVRMQLDAQWFPVASPWRVLSPGTIVDAGRGLPAIDVLRRLGREAQTIGISSDLPALDGATFPAQGLAALIAQQREMCRW
jgi:type VI secretion system protein VasI